MDQRVVPRRNGTHLPPGHQGRHLLACASSGGHFKQLVTLVDRTPDLARVTWFTPEDPTSRTLLDATGHGGDMFVPATYAAPRDGVNLVRNAHEAAGLLRRLDLDLVVSTGAGIAVATLPQARARGLRSVYVESATRATAPSLSGRLLWAVPGIELRTQTREYGRRWRSIGSVHDGFRPDSRPPRRLERVVVVLGTIKPYQFPRLVARLAAVLPPGADVLWQTGATDVSGLGIVGRETVPSEELQAAMRKADLVIAHAGTGTAVTAFQAGIAPVLVPRRPEHGEHVDDHQVATARDLATRGLVTHLEVGDLTLQRLVEASACTVATVSDPPQLSL